MLSPGPADPAGRWRGIAQLAFFPLHRFVPRDDKLRDAVARVHRVRLFAEIQHYDSNFATVTRVDSRRTVRQSDGVLDGQPPPGPPCRFVPGRSPVRVA